MVKNLQTELMGKFPNIQIKDKRLFPLDISVSASSVQYTRQRGNFETDAEATEYLKHSVAEGEYIGDCNIMKYSRLGHLVKLANGEYAVVALNHNTVVYVSSFLSDFRIVAPGNNTKTTIAGKEVDVAKIELSHHYLQNLGDRLKLPPEAAQPVFMDTVLNGRYIGVTHAKEDKKPAHLYAKEGIVVYVSLDLKKAVTVYSNGFSGDFIHPGVNDKIVDMLVTELDRLSKKEKDLEKRNTLEQLKTNLRIAQLELDLYRSRSEEKRVVIQQELDELRGYMEPLQREWEVIVDEVRQHAIALAAFV